MSEEKNSPLVKPILGLLGATMRAMSLIPFGVLSWIIIRLRAATATSGGLLAASNIFMPALSVLIGVLLITLFWSQLAKIYPAGFAICVYFAEKTWLDTQGEKRSGPHLVARSSPQRPFSWILTFN
jgi:hypothetical protein